MSAISPTVRHWYEENPDWATNKVLRAARHFGTSKDVDIHGFDVKGWDERGLDRAGYAQIDYAAEPPLADLVSRFADHVKGAANPASPLSKTIPASGTVMDLLLESWPYATVSDALDGPKLEDGDFVPDPAVVIYRSIDQHGALHVGLNVRPASPDGGTMWPRGLTFAFDREAAMGASDPIGTTSFSVTIHDGVSTPEWEVMTDLRTIEEVSAVAARVISVFSADRLYYAISVEDDDMGGHVSATAISDDAAEDERHVARLVSGDYLRLETGSSRLGALLLLKEGGRLRSLVLKEMLDRGIALEQEWSGSAPSLG